MSVHAFELSLGLDRRVGRLGLRPVILVVGTQQTERVVDVQHTLQHESDHLLDVLVGCERHDLTLAHRILRAVHHVVEMLGHHVQVLGVDGRGERLRQGGEQLALTIVCRVLELADAIRAARIASRPLDQRLDALDRDGRLRAQHADHVEGLREEPGALHANHLQMG